ncbi:MAG: hypothetical protein U0175_33075 [Caldilineaceae bacterium]
MANKINSLPTSIETSRLLVRAYCIDDSSWYWVMGQRNREHLARFETGNSARHLQSEAEAKALLQEFISAWENRQFYCMAAFSKASGEFVAQLYVGPGAGLGSLKVPEYSVGYFGDVAYGGQGYVTEMVKAGHLFIVGSLWLRLVMAKMRSSIWSTNIFTPIAMCWTLAVDMVNSLSSWPSTVVASSVLSAIQTTWNWRRNSPLSRKLRMCSSSR